MSDWKDYQEEAAEFFRSLGLDANTNVTIQGVRTKHDVDVLVKSHLYGFDVTWIVECKRWKEPISKLHVLALREIVTDVGADRGILLSEAGFQSGAVEAANLTNVQVTSLAESASEAYTLDHHVGDLVALLDALGLERVGIVSHDIGAMVAQAFAHKYPNRLFGLFFFNLPYPGIGSRWAAPEHLNEIWYQGFHQQPWAAQLVGSSRAAARIYFGNMLAHWAHDPHAFDEDLDIWVDNFLAPGNLQGGFNWYTAIFPQRLKIMRGELPPAPPIATPTCVRWGEHEPFMLLKFADRLGDYFTDLDFEPAPNAGHFVHYERPDYANHQIMKFFTRVAAR